MDYGLLSVEIANERMAEANRVAEHFSRAAAARRAAAANTAAARGVFARVLRVIPGRAFRPAAARAA
jgi:hypothetical protein